MAADMVVLPIFCCYVLFLESKWQRKEERSQKVQGLEALRLLTSWDFQGRILSRMGVVCKPIDEPAKGGR